ncbi:MAG: HIT domain-containing protein [Treponema sp.]|jgi:ATP adenylyltransferase|nr:HIT domain-containing protein [Treponema sp.]
MGYFFSFQKMNYVKGKKPEGCILCLVRDKSPDVENLVVYQNNFVGITLNLFPYNPGHLMIFPLRHETEIRNLSKEERHAFDDALDLSLTVLDKVYHPYAYNIGYNMGKVAGASIDHLHQHVIPRYPNEVGITELIVGNRVLVEDIRESYRRIQEAFNSLLQE